MDSGYLVCASPPQFYIDSFETSQVFGHGLNICMWFGYNPQCHRLNCDYNLGGLMGSVLMCIFSVD